MCWDFCLAWMLQSSTGDEVSRNHLQQWGVLLPHEQEGWCNGSAVSNDAQPRGFTLRIPSTALSAMRGTYSGAMWSSGWLKCRLTLFPSHRFIRNVCGGLVWKVIFWFTRCTWRMGYMVEKASCNSRDLPQKSMIWIYIEWCSWQETQGQEESLWAQSQQQIKVCRSDD